MLNSASYASVYYVDGDNINHYLKIINWLRTNIGNDMFDYDYDTKIDQYKIGLHDESTAVMLTLIFGNSL